MIKLIELQARLKAPKNQYNSFGKYSYRSTEDIVEGAKPLLEELGLLLNVSDEIVLIGERYYIKATATISDGETEVSATGWAREDESKKGMDASQLTGATSSYARKYALNGLLAIDDTKDSDSTNKHGKGNGEAQNGLTEPQVKRLFAIAKGKGIEPAAVKAKIIKEFDVKDVAELTKQQYDSIVRRIETAKAKE